ncbi:hypothetical protein BT96DRAFT_973929 [Gymnopus androsaceus JB14]|uniref:Uncharacterized protein n=1 Tax=Gymnopus androsaceus JB14 TaxID=1447944 RepID=A0A6A4HYX3_9AGAR|nr:hypothetical protein BT96DRAFT_973929 [Gymnopus androsaceus JB14]
MGQSWKFISLDNAQRIGHGSMGKMGEFFWEENSIITLLIAPVVPASFLEDDTLDLSPKLDTSNELAPILTLPPELLLLITEYLISNYVDVLCLSLTCPIMWSATSRIRYLSLSTKPRRQSWAGSRLICLGGYAEDLPTGFITSSDLEQMDKKLGNPTVFEEDDGPTEPRDLALLYRASYAYFSAAERPTISRTSEKRDFWPEPKSNGDRWMLRNLSKKEFVIKNRLKGGMHGLIQALYTLISWSDDASISMQCEEEVSDAIICGPWAGDRIDVTLRSVHDSEKEGESWKDITVRVAGVVDGLSKSDYRGKFKFDEDD